MRANRRVPMGIAGVALLACGGTPKVPRYEGPDLDAMEPPEDDGDLVPSRTPSKVLPEAVRAAIGNRRLYVAQFDSLLLFEAERLEAHRIIAEWAAAAGIRMVSPAKVEERIGKAARGLDPTTSKACGPRLDRDRALERWVMADGNIHAWVDCRSDCVLQVAIQLDALGTEFFSAPFDVSRPWREEPAEPVGRVAGVRISDIWSANMRSVALMSGRGNFRARARARRWIVRTNVRS
jgi:hypothetical protein